MRNEQRQFVMRLAVCVMFVAGFASTALGGSDRDRGDAISELVGASGELVHVPVSSTARSRVVEVRPHASAILELAEMYEFDTVNRAGESVRGQALIAPFTHDSIPGSLVLYSDGSQRIKLGSIGVPLIEDDWSGRFRALLSQLAWKNSSATVETVPSVSEVKRLAQSALASMQEDDISGKILQLRLAMRENSARFSQLSFGDRKRVVTSDWLRGWAENIGSHEQLSEGVIKHLYGKEAALEFSEYSISGMQELELAAAAVDEGDIEKYREIANGLYKDSCQACHGITAGPEGVNIYRDLPTRFDQYGVRSDLFVVGIDVLGVKGMERESQKISDAVAVMILYWNALNK